MDANKIYTGFLKSQGSASDLTLYSPRVKDGRILHITQISATVYTTKYGDYVTAKYIAVGIERNGQKRLIQIKDMGTTYGEGINLNVDVFLTPGDRVWVKFEATATTTTYEVNISGQYLG